jgi:hypothetical protein
MSENIFPAEWNEKKVQRVLAHYEGQTEGEAATEDEAELSSRPAVGRRGRRGRAAAQNLDPRPRLS